MIERIEISSQHYTATDDVRKYVHKKIGRLDRFMASHAKKSAHAQVKLKQEKAKDKNRYTAEVILFVPHGKITAKESTMNIYAAIDIVEAKLKTQLKRAKDKVTEHPQSRSRLLGRLKKLARR